MKTLCAVLSLCLACAAQAGELINPGFEAGDFTGWTTFGKGWRTSGWAGDEHSDFYKGRLGAVCDVDLRRSNEWCGISQTVRAQEGARYSFGAWICATAVRSSESYVELQFLDKNTNILQHFQSAHVQAEQGFTFMGLDAVEAPKGTEAASLRGIVHLTGKPTDKTEFHIFDEFIFGTMFELRDVNR
jgi:hypothetical protein